MIDYFFVILTNFFEILAYVFVILFGLPVALLFLFWVYRKFICRRPTEPDSRKPTSQPSIIVVLVHGTWATDAPWMNENSTLCTALRKSFEDEIWYVPFQWSGKNSFEARADAAEKLTERLQNLASENPKARLFIIGHSHGGIVALKATTGDIADRISGIFCISTPVLTIRKRSYGNLEAEINRIVLRLQGQNHIAPNDSMANKFQHGIIKYERFHGIDIIVIISSVIWTVLLAFSLARVFENQFHLYINRYAEELIGGSFYIFRFAVTVMAIVIIAFLASSEAEHAKNVEENYGDMPADKVLFVRSPGDEASLAIGAAHVYSRVAEIIASLTVWIPEMLQKLANSVPSRSIYFIIGFSSIVLIIALIAAVYSNTTQFDWIALIVILFGLSFSIGCVLLLVKKGALLAPEFIVYSFLFIPQGMVAFVANLLAVGWVSPIIAAMTHITGEPCPSGQWTVQLVGFVGPLQHSVHKSEVALGVIAEWIRQRVLESS